MPGQNSHVGGRGGRKEMKEDSEVGGPSGVSWCAGGGRSLNVLPLGAGSSRMEVCPALVRSLVLCEQAICTVMGTVSAVTGW